MTSARAASQAAKWDAKFAQALISTSHGTDSRHQSTEGMIKIPQTTVRISWEYIS